MISISSMGINIVFGIFLIEELEEVIELLVVAAAVAVGTAGQALISGGAGVAPTFAAVVASAQTFDIQFSVDITAGVDKYLIHADSIFGYTINSVNARTTDIGTCTAQLVINTTAVTGTSLAGISTTPESARDTASAANVMAATDELYIDVTAVATSPTLLTGVIHCTRTLA